MLYLKRFKSILPLSKDIAILFYDVISRHKDPVAFSQKKTSPPHPNSRWGVKLNNNLSNRYNGTGLIFLFNDGYLWFKDFLSTLNRNTLFSLIRALKVSKKVSGCQQEVIGNSILNSKIPVYYPFLILRYLTQSHHWNSLQRPQWHL